MVIVKSVPVWQRAIVILSGTVVGFLIVVALQWGRPVLIPIAVAVLLTFLLNPVVKAFHHRGLSQFVSVMTAVSAAGIILMCLGWVVTKQVSGMVAELPQNTARIKAKVKTLKELATGPTKDRIGQMIEEISEEIYLPAAERTAVASGEAKEQVDPRTGLVIVQENSAYWTSLTGYMGSAFEILGTLALSLVLLVFFLIEREDLRDRVVLLAGKARLALTSKALEDITDRISRYIGMVALVNGGFGLVLTGGLMLLGVPYALLWGFLAATLRFIPYIGPWIGAVFPITMSLAMSDGWGQPLGVFAFVAVIELFTNNVVEPLLFGHTTGVSPTALLVSAATWLYLWGPIGLVLSASFAVCLVVIGKNIPQLSFLYLLLGDKPALNADYSYYQRLMLGEYHEAANLALKRLKSTSAELTYDEMIVPVLNFTKRDVGRDYLTEDDQRTIVDGIRVTLGKIDDELSKSTDWVTWFSTPKAAIEQVDLPELGAKTKVLACPATDDSDRVVLEMLGQLLEPNRWALKIESSETLTSELIMRVRAESPAMIVIASVPPGGLAHCLYLCKRLRKAASGIPILVLRCGQKRNISRERDQLEKAGASFVRTTLVQMRDLLNARLPLVQARNVARDLADVPHQTEEIDESSAVPLLK